jgi:hypothetical protein
MARPKGPKKHKVGVLLLESTYKNLKATAKILGESPTKVASDILETWHCSVLSRDLAATPVRSKPSQVVVATPGKVIARY